MPNLLPIDPFAYCLLPITVSCLEGFGSSFAQLVTNRSLCLLPIAYYSVLFRGIWFQFCPTDYQSIPCLIDGQSSLQKRQFSKRHSFVESSCYCYQASLTFLFLEDFICLFENNICSFAHTMAVTLDQGIKPKLFTVLGSKAAFSQEYYSFLNTIS